MVRSPRIYEPVGSGQSVERKVKCESSARWQACAMFPGLRWDLLSPNFG